MLAVAVGAMVTVLPDSSWAATFYVNVRTGDDGNGGLHPTNALRTIGAAAARTQTGDEVIVAPGTYREGDISPKGFARVTITADRTAGGDVVVNADGFQTGFLLNGALNVTVDGFVVYGGVFGIYVKSGAHQARIVNNIVSGNYGNGIYVQDSNGALIFNNLVYNNNGSGILVTGNTVGSRDVKVINNTVYANQNRGIFFAGSTIPSSGGVTLNNVAEGNFVAEIQVNPISLPGHVKAGNVTTGRLASGTPRDGTDIIDLEEGVLFVDPAGPDGILGGAGYHDDDFRLLQVDSGDGQQSPAVDAGAGTVAAFGLEGSTTRTDGRADEGIVDAGFHYGNIGVGRVPDLQALRYQRVFVDSVNGNNNYDGSTPGRAIRTIQRAVSRSRGGHEIHLAPGTYREGDIELANLGLGSRPIRVTGSQGTRIDAGGFQRAFLVERSSRLDLRGVEVNGASIAAVQVRHESEFIASNVLLRQNCGHGLWILQESIARLSDFEIIQNGRIGITSMDSMVYLERGMIRANRREGIRVRGGAGLDATDTDVVQNERDGVTAAGAESFVWRRGRVEGNRANGLQVADTTFTDIDETYHRGNCGDGLTFLGSGTARVANVRSCRNGSTGILNHGANLTIDVGVLEGNGLEGVQVKRGALMASDVLVLHNASKGASTFESEELSWHGGRIAHNGSIGLHAAHTKTVSIDEVGIYSNSGNGITLTGGDSAAVSKTRSCHNGSTGIASDDIDVNIEEGVFNNNKLEGVRTKGGSLGAMDVVSVENGTKGVSTFESESLVWQGGRVADNGGNGIQAFGTRTIAIHNTMSHTNRGDGITIYDGDTAQIVNNLVYGNNSTGILLTNSGAAEQYTTPNAEVLNNTVYQNTNRGLLMGDSRQVTAASALVARNIFSGNGIAGISVSSPSMPGYVGDFNFSSDRYGPFTSVGLNDIVHLADPLFVNPSGPDGILGGAGWADDAFQLQQIAAGQDADSAGVDAGGVSVVAAGFGKMTTRTDRVADQGMVDLGYHYPVEEPPAALACETDDDLDRSLHAAWDCDGEAGPAYETVDCSSDFRIGNDAGDCDGNGMVSINELVTAVNIALGAFPAQRCWSADLNGDGRVTIDELISAVRNALRPIEMNCQLS